MSWDRPLFAAGTRLRARHSFERAGSSFVAGELLRFTEHGYSHYDSCFVYTFLSESTGQKKHWWLHDDEPSELWREHFEVV